MRDYSSQREEIENIMAWKSQFDKLLDTDNL